MEHSREFFSGVCEATLALYVLATKLALEVHWTSNLSEFPLRVAFARYALSASAGRRAARVCKVLVGFSCVRGINFTPLHSFDRFPLLAQIAYCASNAKSRLFVINVDYILRE